RHGNGGVLHLPVPGRVRRWRRRGVGTATPRGICVDRRVPVTGGRLVVGGVAGPQPSGGGFSYAQPTAGCLRLQAITGSSERDWRAILSQLQGRIVIVSLPLRSEFVEETRVIYGHTGR